MYSKSTQRLGSIIKSQQGIALITILMLVALATILAATIAKRQMYTSENTAYLMRQNQALLYAKSAEVFFAELLQDDAENAGQVDHLQENWAKPMPPSLVALPPRPIIKCRHPASSAAFTCSPSP